MDYCRRGMEMENRTERMKTRSMDKEKEEKRNEEEEEKEETVEEEEKVEEELSKKERKRRANMVTFLEKRKKKRIEERAKKKEKRAALKASGLGESLRKAKNTKMSESTCKMRLVIDMSFDNLMLDKDRRRCISQLTFCYSVNRKQDNPSQMFVTSFNGPTRELFDTNGTYGNWDVNLHREDLEEIIDKNDIVYLTADSPNVITHLDDSKAYIIGGLVDHNAHKGICYEKAEGRGWAHGRLPIDEFVKMQSRKVLTINHVFEIMIMYWNTGNWEDAFFSVIPKRKGAEKRSEEETEEGEEGDKGEVEGSRGEGEGGDKGEKVWSAQREEEEESKLLPVRVIGVIEKNDTDTTSA